MPPELLSLLTQIPLVAVFVWFVLEWSKRNQASQEKRDHETQQFLADQRAQDRAAISDLTKEVRHLCDLLLAHDKKADVMYRLGGSQEKTRPRGREGGREGGKDDAP